MTQEILLEQRDGIALVTIDRPQVRNALTIAMCRELIGLFERLATDTDARVVVLRGNGGHFWVFHTGLTDLSYELTVRDTVTGAVRIYPGGATSGTRLCGAADTSAF